MPFTPLSPHEREILAKRECSKVAESMLKRSLTYKERKTLYRIDDLVRAGGGVLRSRQVIATILFMEHEK